MNHHPDCACVECCRCRFDNEPVSDCALGRDGPTLPTASSAPAEPEVTEGMLKAGIDYMGELTFMAPLIDTAVLAGLFRAMFAARPHKYGME